MYSRDSRFILPLTIIIIQYTQTHNTIQYNTYFRWIYYPLENYRT